jgi:hypothetical protein
VDGSGDVPFLYLFFSYWLLDWDTGAGCRGGEGGCTGWEGTGGSSRLVITLSSSLGTVGRPGGEVVGLIPFIFSYLRRWALAITGLIPSVHLSFFFGRFFDLFSAAE